MLVARTACSPPMPSRPGEFHPEPPHRSGLDTLASSGSCHRTKAAAFRRELELLLLPVGSLPTAMTCPLRSTSITPASAPLQGSPPLSGASVLSASRLEPLAPCMGLSESIRDLSSPPLSFFRPISLFDRGDHPFVPTRTSLTSARAGAVKVGRRTNLTACSAVARPHLDSFEHDGTLDAIGMTIRGEPAFGRGSIAPQPCIRWDQGPDHDAAMRIGSEAPKRRTHSSPRHNSHGTNRDPPPRTVIGDRHKWTD